MQMHHGNQARRPPDRGERGGAGPALIVPNPKLKLLDQVREVMRLKHYSIRTERCYCDWIRRYIKFHGMRSREDLQKAEPKIEQFLSDLAVNGHVSASTQNQAFNALLFLYREILHQTLENSQAGEFAYVPAQFCDARPSARGRHPHDPGTARPQ
jgi:hypothetical protein